jgi:hypothetical protein
VKNEKQNPFAMWQAEIEGRETDMPGTNADRCNFADCYYVIPGSSTRNPASFPGGSFGVTPQTGNRPDEWGIVVSKDDFQIWDKFPLIP